MSKALNTFLSVILVSILLLMTPGCRERAPEKVEPAAEEVSAQEAEPVETEVIAADSASREKFLGTVSEVGPVISLEGSPDELPGAVKFMFHTSVVDQKYVGGKPDKDTVIRITPEVKGKARWTSTRVLTFTPDEPLPHDSAFKIELERVMTLAGVVEPREGEQWAKKFVTPGFDIRRVELEDVDFRSGEAGLVITFTGPVSMESLVERCEVKAGEEKLDPSRLSFKRKAPEKVLLKVSSRQLGLQRKLKVTFSPGITTPNGNYSISKSVTREFSLSEPDKIRITEVRVNEGESAYYIEVLCRDEAAEKESGYRRYYDLCNLDPESVEDFVKVHPPVKVSTTTVRNGFRVFGDFRRGSYTLTVDSGLRSTMGGLLTSTYETTVNVPARRPRLHFISRGRYLPREWIKAVPVSHVNVDEADLTIRQIFEDNIVFWLSAENEIADDRISDVIAQKSFGVQGDEDVNTTNWLDISDLLPADKKGVFELTLSGKERTDVSRLILTDMALVTKRHGEEGKDLDIWVFNVEDHSPVVSARVDIITASNRSLANCYTDIEGACHFKGVADPLAQKKPFAVTAKRGADLIAFRFSDLVVPTGDHDVQGDPFRLVKPYQAAIYADRGVYRPGEVAHVVAILRDDANMAPEKGLPVMGRLMDPRKKQVIQLRATANKAGMAEFTIPFQDYAATGKYEFILEVAGNRIAGHTFNVEEFVPERLKVNVSAGKTAYLQSEPVAVSVEARYLFGAMAGGEKVELSCTLHEDVFRPGKNREYSYSVHHKDFVKPVAIGSLSGELDERGSAKFDCPAVENVTSFRGQGRLVAMASVFESGSGRTTVSRTSVPVHPDKFYIGLKSSAAKASPGKPIEVRGIIVDWEGGIITEEREVEFEVYRLDSEQIWEYDESSGRQAWKRFVREIILQRESVKTKDGLFSVSFTPEHIQEGFLVRARSGDRAETDLVISSEKYRRYWEPHVAQIDHTPKPTQPESLLIEVPERIDVGETARVVIHSIYRGRMLFTVETDKLLESRWLNVEAGPVELTFSVGEFYPNVYASALLLRDPHLDSGKSFMPGRAFGVRSIPIVPKQHEMKILVEGPREVKPKEKLVISLDVGRQFEPVYATVAAVDEGILQLTDYQTPDPLGLLFQQRALGVETFETIGWTLLVPPVGPEKSTGGGMAEEGVMPPRIPPVRPVALWSGIVEVPESGKARIEFDVPLYRGSLRVIAVASSRSRVGVDVTSVLVRDPLVLQTTFPRFLLDGDRFVVPVFLTNMTGRADTFKVRFNAGKGIDIEGDSEKSISLSPDQSGTITFLAKAESSFGAADFEVVAKGADVTSRDDGRIPFLPNNPFIRESSVTALEEGKNDLREYLKGWEPQYEKTTIWVTSGQYAKELSHLKYLVRYPYGCIEQTTSSTRPLLYIGDLLSGFDPEFIQDAGIEEKFMHGVNRLLSMQTSEGGFSYWPGETAPTYWGTAYVCHVFLLGRKLGYPIPEDRLDDALTFMEESLNRGDLSGRDAKYGYSVAKSEPYMQYVLALAGRDRKGRIKQLIDNPNPGWEELKGENLYLLKAALYLGGDRSYESDLKHPGSIEISDRRTNGWSFWSELRTRGMMLDIMEELFPAGSDAEPLARNIAARLARDKSHYYTTQELSWCASALGRRASSAAESWSEPELVMDGDVIEPLPKSAKAKGKQATWLIRGASGAKSLKLKVDRIKGGALSAMVTVEGIKLGEPYRPEDNSLKVRREYRRADGSSVSLEEVRLGDVIYVELTLSNLKNERIQNVALVDRFAAGLEIENPRLKRSHVTEWMERRTFWETDYINMRDDRIEMFGHLNPGETVKAVYVLRAVTAGEFNSPPVKAEAMYEPRYRSLSLGQPIKIIDPWKVLVD